MLPLPLSALSARSAAPLSGVTSLVTIDLLESDGVRVFDRALPLLEILTEACLASPRRPLELPDPRGEASPKVDPIFSSLSDPAVAAARAREDMPRMLPLASTLGLRRRLGMPLVDGLLPPDPRAEKLPLPLSLPMPCMALILLSCLLANMARAPNRSPSSAAFSAKRVSISPPGAGVPASVRSPGARVDPSRSERTIAAGSKKFGPRSRKILSAPGGARGTCSAGRPNRGRNRWMRGPPSRNSRFTTAVSNGGGPES
jgi:hypothetical protein